MKKKTTYECEWCGEKFFTEERCREHEKECQKTHFVGSLFQIDSETGCDGMFVWRLKKENLSHLNVAKTRVCDWEPEKIIFEMHKDGSCAPCGFKSTRLTSVSVKGEEIQALELLEEKTMKMLDAEREMIQECFANMKKQYR